MHFLSNKNCFVIISFCFCKKENCIDDIWKNETKLISRIYNGIKINKKKKNQNVKKNYKRFSTRGPTYSTAQKLKFCKITGASDLKLKYVKRFLRKFYWKDPNLKWKLQAVLEFFFQGEWQKYTLLLRTKDMVLDTRIITKCDSYFITKYLRFLISKCNSYYKMRRYTAF